MKPFERWKYEEIELTFGTERVDRLKTLDSWLEADEPADDFERRTIMSYHEQLVRKVDAWNVGKTIKSYQHFFRFIQHVKL